MEHQKIAAWYNQNYAAAGLNAQRRYPNEELLRFMGRHYFRVPHAERQQIRVLELGCGSGANLWMLAREGYQTCGLDLSSEAIQLAGQMLAQWQTTAELKVGSMTAPPWTAASFDVVLDVFSAFCLNMAEFGRCLQAVHRVLKPQGRFFMFTPSKRSEAFTHPGDAKFLDDSTLDGIRRPDAPYAGNHYPFRFVHPAELKTQLEAHGFEVTYLETVGRTYRQEQEYFEFVVAEAVRGS